MRSIHALTVLIVSCLLLAVFAGRHVVSTVEAAAPPSHTEPGAFIWIGAESNEWHNAANWIAPNGSTRPYPSGAEDDVIIAVSGPEGGPEGGVAGVSCSCEITGDVLVRSLTILNGAVVCVTNGTLTIQQSNGTSGTLTIEEFSALYIRSAGTVKLVSAVRHVIGGHIVLETPSSKLLSSGETVWLHPWPATTGRGPVHGFVIGKDDNAFLGIQHGTTLENGIHITGAMHINGFSH